jgi:hypothetical protein
VTTPPGEVLKLARAAAEVEDHTTALLHYERFFDRALQDQGENNNYYGVRLSYCLDEWVRLGKKYPLALQRLDVKASEALAAFEATREPGKFHDFRSIRDHLGQRDEVMAQFIAYHHSDAELASVALHYMWNRLVETKRWDICACYLKDADAKYSRALNRFVQAMAVCLSDPSLGGDDFAEQIKGWYIRDAGNLLAALRNSEYAEAAIRIEAAVAADMKTHGFPDLISRVSQRAAL